MNIEALRAAFLTAYENKQILSVVLGPDRPGAYKYSIFPLLCLENLRNEVQKNAYSVTDDEEDLTHNFGARFIVDLDGIIKFSREGARSRNIPAHSDIEPKAYAAGNIYFSEDYSKIVKITNKSGHFKPHFSTIVHALPLILQSGFPLADEIELQFTRESDDISMKLNQEQLRSLIPDAYDLTNEMSKNTSQEIFIDESYNYSPQETRPKSKKRALFATNPSEASINERREIMMASLPLFFNGLNQDLLHEQGISYSSNT